MALLVHQPTTPANSASAAAEHACGVDAEGAAGGAGDGEQRRPGASTPPVAANVSGSIGSTSTSTAPTIRPSAAASSRPTARPPANTGAMPPTTRRTHVAGRGAERPPHREVAHALLHGVADDPEDADHRQRQRQAGEGDDEHGAEPVALGRRPGDVLERPDVAHADQLIAIDAGDGRPHAPSSAPRRRRSRRAPPGRCRRRRAARSAGRPGRTPPARPGGRAPGARRRRSRRRTARRAATTRAAARAARRAASGPRRWPRTSASLTRHTGGLSAVSRSVKPRPATIGRSIAAKYVGAHDVVVGGGTLALVHRGIADDLERHVARVLRGQRQLAGPGDARRRPASPRSRVAPRRRTGAATRGSGSAIRAGRRTSSAPAVARDSRDRTSRPRRACAAAGRRRRAAPRRWPPRRRRAGRASVRSRRPPIGCRRRAPRVGSTSVACQAGATPKSSPTASVAAAQNAATRRSKTTVTAGGSRPAGISDGAAPAIAAPIAEAEQAADDREHQALGHQLADDAGAAGAERGADRQLAGRAPPRAPAAGAPRWRSRSAARSRRRRGTAATSAAARCRSRASCSGSTTRPPAGVRGRELPREARGDALEVGARGVERDAGCGSGRPPAGSGRRGPRGRGRSSATAQRLVRPVSWKSRGTTPTIV